MVRGSCAVLDQNWRRSMNRPPIRHRERSVAIHRRKSAVMDCRTSFAMTGIDCTGSWFMCSSEPELAARNDIADTATK
jgi:hypothetical protein